MKKFFYTLAACTALSSQVLYAHGIAGDRIFPATLAIDDPAVSDEMTLPQEHYAKDSDGAWNSETSFEYDKLITQNWGIGVSGGYVNEKDKNGFDNFGLSTKYQFYENDPHELLLSVGTDWDIGGTGSKKIGAERFSTVSPTFFFGKGMGDLPDSAPYLKPFAVTGALGLSLPTQAKKRLEDETNPDSFNWGFTLQYSLPYLEQHVKSIGLPQPLNQMIPIVEFDMQNNIDRGASRKTTGTINPGFIWSGETTQFGLEAVLPVNDESGKGVGVIAQMHFFLDDIFPNTIGKPIF